MSRAVNEPQCLGIKYSIHYRRDLGVQSTRGERLVTYCLGDYADKEPPPCTGDPEYLANKFVLLFQSSGRVAVIRTVPSKTPISQKRILEAWVTQRADIPSPFSCWLINGDNGGSNSDPDQGLHVAGMRRARHRHLVLVPTACRDRFLGPLLAQQMAALTDDWTPWNEKSDKAWWGGALTGDNWDSKRRQTLTRRMVLEHFTRNPSDAVRLHLASSGKKPVAGTTVLGPFTKRDAFSHKAIILLPGNDIASGSSWYFAGNSVVMMPRPHMEHILYFELNAWEHYVPLENDPVDIEKKLTWVLENQEEARRIVERAHRRLEWLTGPEYQWACNEVLRKISGGNVRKNRP